MFDECYSNISISLGETAILSSLNKFISVNPEDDSVVASSVAAGEREFCQLRSNRAREDREVVLPGEEQADLAKVEVNYVYVTNILVTINY